MRFEDVSVLGFLYEFSTVANLSQHHRAREQAVLSAHAPLLRAAGRKAWNVYSIFLTAESQNGSAAQSVMSIDEDLSMTRKIARCGITTEGALRAALLPLLPIASQPHISNDDYACRVQAALTSLTDETFSKAFFGPTTSAELLQMLVGDQ